MIRTVNKFKGNILDRIAMILLKVAINTKQSILERSIPVAHIYMNAHIVGLEQ